MVLKSRPKPVQNDLYEFNHITDVPVPNFVKSMDCRSIADTLLAVPYAFRHDLLDEYVQRYSKFQSEAKIGNKSEAISFKQARLNANEYFLTVRNYVKGHRCLNSSDASLRSKAKHLARYAAVQIKNTGISAGLHLLDTHSIAAPNADSSESLKARLVDEQWWIQQLIKKQDRQFEQTAIRLGRVRKHKQVYVSNETLEKIISRQKRSLAMMENKVAISDEGDEVDMLDILKGSPANPAVRRAELMNRLHGFEQYGDAHGHSAEFYTITAPSYYHANSSKHNQWTPRQVQKHYFSPLWAKIRAKLKYKGLNVYGFRIAEAHGDACPHWHILLFMPKNAVSTVRAILKDYALRESGDEKGATKNRFDHKTITKEKGSAIGYIAKYISKNVDGFGMKNDIEAETGIPINESAQRVRAWASVWGIRQFQQIGGSSITVWRELRRLDGKQDDPKIEAARLAADKGNWQAYLEAQGGTDTLRKDQHISPYRCYRYNAETGEVTTNQYGELVDHIQGVATVDTTVKTRLKNWTIQQKPEPENTAHPSQISVISPNKTVEQDVQRLLTPVPCSSTVLGHVENLDLETVLAFDLPWSSVNNCRIPEKKYKAFAGFSLPSRE